MTRGTTPTYTFKMSMAKETIKDIWITFKQEMKIEEDRLLTKTMSDGSVIYDGTEVSLTLTQQETLDFKEGVPIEIQGKVLTTLNKVIPTDIKKEGCSRILNEEVMQ